MTIRSEIKYRFDNSKLIKLQKRELKVIKYMHDMKTDLDENRLIRLFNKHEEIVTQMEKEVEYLHPAMMRLDEKGMYIPADRSEIFYDMKGWLK